MEFEKYYSPDGKDFRGYLIKHNGKYLSTDWEFTVDLDKTHACRITPEMLGGQFEAEVMQKIAEDIDIKTAIEKYFDLTHNILECECDEYNGVTCGLHIHQNLSRNAKEKLSRFSV